MNSTRKLIATGSGAAALFAALAFALAPVTVLAEGSHKSHPKTESAQTLVAPTAACTAARAALAKARADDKVADALERQALKEGSLTLDAKKALDASERAAMKTLRDKVRAECAGQARAPLTQACLTAKQALKDALKAGKDAATLKSLKDAKHAACVK